MKSEIDRFTRLRDAIVNRLELCPSNNLAAETSYALAVVCDMRAPGICVLLLRSCSARIVYRRDLVDELERLKESDVAKRIKQEPTCDDRLLVVALNGAATPRCCLVDISALRTRRPVRTAALSSGGGVIP